MSIINKTDKQIEIWVFIGYPSAISSIRIIWRYFISKYNIISSIPI